MKEYKAVETKKSRLEQLMNNMAQQGWEVVDVTYYYGWFVSLIVTFCRDK